MLTRSAPDSLEERRGPSSSINTRSEDIVLVIEEDDQDRGFRSDDEDDQVDDQVLEPISPEAELQETWNAYFLSILLAQAKNPALKYMILSLYFATTLYGASAGLFGPQATLEELYGVDNDFVKNYADTSCVELNTLLRFFYLQQTLKLLDNAYKGVSSLGWLDWLVVPTVVSVTGGDTCLGLVGSASEHWQKPRLYSVAGITALELLFLNFRNVTQTYGLLFRKFYHSEQQQLIKYITAIRLYLYTLEPFERLSKFKELLGISELQTEQEIMGYLTNKENKNRILYYAKEACDDLGLLSEGKHVTAISCGSIFYALIGGTIASYEWIKYLTAQGSPTLVTGLIGSFSIMAKTCGYSIALSALIDIITNHALLIKGVKTTSSQNKGYFLAVALAVLVFTATVPPSGLSFFLPTNDILTHFFPDWVEEGGIFYQIILPVFGAMGSIANSIGATGMCKILLDALRKEIDKITLEGDMDVCKLLDDLETHILRGTMPDRQAIVFLCGVIYSLFKTPVETAEYGDHIAYSETNHYIADTPYTPSNASNFFQFPRGNKYGTFSASGHATPSPS